MAQIVDEYSDESEPLKTMSAEQIALVLEISEEQVKAYLSE